MGEVAVTPPQGCQRRRFCPIRKIPMVSKYVVAWLTGWWYLRPLLIITYCYLPLLTIINRSHELFIYLLNTYPPTYLPTSKYSLSMFLPISLTSLISYLNVPLTHCLSIQSIVDRSTSLQPLPPPVPWKSSLFSSRTTHLRMWFTRVTATANSRIWPLTVRGNDLTGRFDWENWLGEWIVHKKRAEVNSLYFNTSYYV